MFKASAISINDNEWGIFEVSGPLLEDGTPRKCIINWIAKRIEVLHELPQHERESLVVRALHRVIQSSGALVLPHRPRLTVVDLDADPPLRCPPRQGDSGNARQSA